MLSHPFLILTQNEHHRVDVSAELQQSTTQVVCEDGVDRPDLGEIVLHGAVHVRLVAVVVQTVVLVEPHPVVSGGIVNIEALPEEVEDEVAAGLVMRGRVQASGVIAEEMVGFCGVFGCRVFVVSAFLFTRLNVVGRYVLLLLVTLLLPLWEVLGSLHGAPLTFA